MKKKKENDEDNKVELTVTAGFTYTIVWLTTVRKKKRKNTKRKKRRLTVCL